MDRGALVPDDVIIGLVGERLGARDAATGFIVDGFPRTIAQAEAFAKLLKDLGHTLDAVVYFDVSEGELLRRLTGRRVCRKCGRTYHVTSAHPRPEGGCEAYGGARWRGDDD